MCRRSVQALLGAQRILCGFKNIFSLKMIGQLFTVRSPGYFKVTEREREKKSLILPGKIKNAKKMRIIICFGDRTRSGTFFTENIKKS